MFKFIDKEEAFEHCRSGFANEICKILFQLNNRNIDQAIQEGEILFGGLHENVRNIYELVDSQIPLMAYSHLKEHGQGNYDFTEEEYLEALERARNACLEYYSE